MPSIPNLPRSAYGSTWSKVYPFAIAAGLGLLLYLTRDAPDAVIEMD